VTPAFKELRASILPKYSPPHAPVDEIRTWMRKWHLDFEGNQELHELVERWVFNVLDYWLGDMQARASLRVDCGWWERWERWERQGQRASGRLPISATLSQWNPEREGFESYAKRIRSNIERFLQEQKRTNEAEMVRYGERPYLKRETKRPPAWDSEWLALHICRELTDGEIAQRKEYSGVSLEVVKKARQALQNHLHILVGN
jgi:hypothetical protein